MFCVDDSIKSQVFSRKIIAFLTYFFLMNDTKDNYAIAEFNIVGEFIVGKSAPIPKV
jgi:hypothetical protein